jgi:hypothetical protein
MIGNPARLPRERPIWRADRLERALSVMDLRSW